MSVSRAPQDARLLQCLRSARAFSKNQRPDPIDSVWSALFDSDDDAIRFFHVFAGQRFDMQSIQHGKFNELWSQCVQRQRSHSVNHMLASTSPLDVGVRSVASGTSVFYYQMGFFALLLCDLLWQYKSRPAVRVSLVMTELPSLLLSAFINYGCRRSETFFSECVVSDNAYHRQFWTDAQLLPLRQSGNFALLFADQQFLETTRQVDTAGLLSSAAGIHHGKVLMAAMSQERLILTAYYALMIQCARHFIELDQFMHDARQLCAQDEASVQPMDEDYQQEQDDDDSDLQSDEPPAVAKFDRTTCLLPPGGIRVVSADQLVSSAAPQPLHVSHTPTMSTHSVTGLVMRMFPVLLKMVRAEHMDIDQLNYLQSLDAKSPGFVEQMAQLAGDLRVMIKSADGDFAQQYGSNQALSARTEQLALLMTATEQIGFTMRAIRHEYKQQLELHSLNSNQVRYFAVEARTHQSVWQLYRELKLDMQYDQTVRLYLFVSSLVQQFAPPSDSVDQLLQFASTFVQVVRLPVRYHELEATMQFFTTHFPQLAMRDQYLLGCDLQGCYLVIDHRLLTMLRYAQLEVLVHTQNRDNRYPLNCLMARTYLTRYVMPNCGEASLIDKALGGPELQPGMRQSMDLFRMECFLDWLCTCLHMRKSSASVKGSSASASLLGTFHGLLTSQNPMFFVYNYLHVLVATLSKALQESSRSMHLDHDMPALNAMRSFLCIGLEHHISRRNADRLIDELGPEAHLLTNLLRALMSMPPAQPPQAPAKRTVSSSVQHSAPARVRAPNGRKAAEHYQADRLVIAFDQRTLDMLKAFDPQHPLIHLPQCLDPRISGPWALWLLYFELMRQDKTGLSTQRQYEVMCDLQPVSSTPGGTMRFAPVDERTFASKHKPSAEILRDWAHSPSDVLLCLAATSTPAKQQHYKLPAPMQRMPITAFCTMVKRVEFLYLYGESMPDSQPNTSLNNTIDRLAGAVMPRFPLLSVTSNGSNDDDSDVSAGGSTTIAPSSAKESKKPQRKQAIVFDRIFVVATTKSLFGSAKDVDRALLNSAHVIVDLVQLHAPELPFRDIQNDQFSPYHCMREYSLHQHRQAPVEAARLTPDSVREYFDRPY